MKGKGSVIYTCQYCGELFRGYPSRSKYKHICCSKECTKKIIEQETKERHKPNATCPMCGKEFWAEPAQLKRFKEVCCSKECALKLRSKNMSGNKNHQYGLKGKDNPTWKSDEKIANYGYKQIRVLSHPFRNKKGYVFEHRLVAEKYLLNENNSVEIDGVLYLKPDLEVHHIDENRLNNDPNNLLVLTKSEHKSLHSKKRWRELFSGRIAKKEYKNMQEILVRRADIEAKLPTKAHKKDAGWDLYSVKDYEIEPHKTTMVDTGLNFSLPDNTFGAIYARSGLASKQGLRPANCVGICDCEYTGNYIVPLYNDSDEIRYIKKHDRIAQLIIQNFVPVNLIEVDSLTETDRGEGGFGSTGVK